MTIDEIKIAMAGTSELFNVEVFGKRNYDALDDIYTTDARIMPPGGATISGRAGIKAFWSGMIESANATSAALTSVDVMLTGDGIVEIGSAALTFRPEGQGIGEMTVKYVVFWKQEDGRWKWHVDIWNANS